MPDLQQLESLLFGAFFSTPFQSSQGGQRRVYRHCRAVELQDKSGQYPKAVSSQNDKEIASAIKTQQIIYTSGAEEESKTKLTLW